MLQEIFSLADELSRFTYRKLQQTIIPKAIKYNASLIFIDPKGTSTTCPRCEAKLDYNHRLAVCLRLGFIAYRDTIGAVNAYSKQLNTSHTP